MYVACPMFPSSRLLGQAVLRLGSATASTGPGATEPSKYQDVVSSTGAVQPGWLRYLPVLEMDSKKGGRAARDRPRQLPPKVADLENQCLPSRPPTSRLREMDRDPWENIG